VILSITDEGIIEDVVPIVLLGQFSPELFDFYFDRTGNGHIFF